MGITGIRFTGLSLWLSLAGLGAQPTDTELKIENPHFQLLRGFPGDVSSGRAGVCEDF
jgi:hypothetical protein